MTATTAVDDMGSVEYLFDCLTVGGTDSDWQSSPTYVDTGLLADTTYEYRVKARDSAGNETAWSEVKAATTFPQPPADPNIYYDPLLVVGMGTGSGILYEAPTELFSHVIVAEYTPDPLGRPIYVRFVCLDEGGFTSPWINAAGPLPLIIDDPGTAWIDQQFQYAGNIVSYQVVVSWGHALYYNWRVELSYNPDGSGEVSYDEVFLAPQF
jgi:hypothetical protein